MPFVALAGRLCGIPVFYRDQGSPKEKGAPLSWRDKWLPIIGPKGEFPRVVSPLDEIIESGKYGYVYGMRHPEELSHLLRECTSHPERLSAMGAAARELALKEFSWDRYIERIEEVLPKC